MAYANQLRQIVLSYLSEGNADRLVLNFASLSHNIHKSEDREAMELANKIEFKMAALHRGLISHTEFKNSILDAVKENIYVDNCAITTAASMVSSFNPVLRLGLEAWATPSAYTQLASV